jgi:hypothetical protein
MDAPHRLLLGHFSNWSKAKGRDVDVQLLESLLDLRATYDDLEPTFWPAGSVQDLLLRLLPAKGPTEPLHSDAVVGALDAYFRFLRSTGRMSARSATPANLAKEASRSAKKMTAAARDQRNRSPTKSMINFGESIGISLDDLPTTEDLQGRLDKIAAAWNDLPIHQRQRLNPREGDLSGRSRAMAAYQTDDEIYALISSFRYEMPQGELAPPSQIAPLIRETQLFNQLEALVRWIKPRAEITSTGVLRPAVARQAFADLGLQAWTREWIRIDYADLESELQPGELDLILDTFAQQPWRSARDCRALDRLWNAALACQVIQNQGRWAYATWPEELTDEGIVNLATRAGLGLLSSYLDDEMFVGIPVLCYALLRSYVRRPRPIPLAEIEEFGLDWSLPPSELARSAQIYRRLLRNSLRRVLYELGDLGIFEQTEEEIALTAWGRCFRRRVARPRARPPRQRSSNSVSETTQLAPECGEVG